MSHLPAARCCSNHVRELVLPAVSPCTFDKGAHGSHGNDASFSVGCLLERHALRSATVHILTSLLLTSGAASREAEELWMALGR